MMRMFLWLKSVVFRALGIVRVSPLSKAEAAIRQEAERIAQEKRKIGWKVHVSPMRIVKISTGDALDVPPEINMTSEKHIFEELWYLIDSFSSFSINGSLPVNIVEMKLELTDVQSRSFQVKLTTVRKEP